MAFAVGSGSPQLVSEIELNISPIAPQSLNVEVLSVPGLLPDKMTLVQIPTLSLGLCVVRAESVVKDLLRIHIFNITNVTLLPGVHMVRVLVP